MRGQKARMPGMIFLINHLQEIIERTINMAEGKIEWPQKPPSGVKDDITLAIDCLKVAIDILMKHYPQNEYEPFDPPEDPPDSPPAQPTTVA